MNKQSKRDVIAAVSLGAMFVGAFMLPATWFGFVLIGAGGLAMLVLFLMVIVEKQ